MTTKVMLNPNAKLDPNIFNTEKFQQKVLLQ